MALLSRAQLKAIFHLRATVKWQDMHAIIDSFMHRTEDNAVIGLHEYNGRLYKAGQTCLKDGLLIQAVRDTQGEFTLADWQMVLAGNIDFVPDGMTVMVPENYQRGVMDSMTVNGVLNLKGKLIIQ